MIPGDQVGDGKPRAPFAIYVGNVNNLVVLNNEATVKLINADIHARTAVLVFGQLGCRIIVQCNFFNGFTSGAFIQHSSAAPPADRLWIVSENVLTRTQKAADGDLNPPLSAVTNIVTA